MRNGRILVVVTAAFGLVAAGCGGGGGDVDVSVQEYAVLPAEDSVGAGEVTFNVTNTGEETHEFVIIKTDLDAGALPTVEDGSVDEEGAGMEVVDEIEDIEAGTSQSVTTDLETGSYVLICNVVEEADGETEAHYSLGMRSAFTVE